MSIKVRFAILLGLLGGVFVLALLFLENSQHQTRTNIAVTERQSQATLLNHWIDASSRELPNIATDFARSEELAKFLGGAVSAEATKKISAALADNNIDTLWVAQGDDLREAVAFSSKGIEARPLPLAGKELAGILAETPSPRFFIEAGSDLLEVCCRRQQVEGGRSWLVLTRRWDAGHLRALSTLTESKVTLRSAQEAGHIPESLSQLVVIRPLHDGHGRVVRVLRIDSDLADMGGQKTADKHQTRLFIAFGLLVLVAMAVALQTWVLRPLRSIGKSLEHENREAVTPLSRESSEFGEMARLVLSSFAQRENLRAEVEHRTRTQEALSRSAQALRENLEERARLGRDLHDGVIQSLYAAGMGLAGIRAELRPDQTEALGRLEQTRVALNDTIQDVRNFIVGLEPEALRNQSFSHAVAALLDSMQSMRAFRATLSMDDSLASRLSLSQRVHALQIAREAVSNALRHGQASHIEIKLHHTGGRAEFKVTDNGDGFDSHAPTSPGHGLLNFAERARELDAELTISSEVGRGTTVNLTFSLP